MADKFGGIPVDEEQRDKFGGVAVEDSSPATPAAKPRGQLFWETIGGQALQDMIGGASRDPEKAKKALDTFKGIVHGIADEPARVWDQLSKSGEAMTKGDISGAASHLGGAVPFIGGTAREVQHDVEKGNYGDALERTAGMVLPLAAPKIPAMVDAAGPALETAGTALKGAAKGAASEATAMVPLNRHGIPLSVPKVVATGSIGATAAHYAGLPGQVGAVIGVTAPIVRAAYRGGRQALRERLLTPAEPPPGFGVTSGSTLSPSTPTAPLVNAPVSQFQPPVGGVFPGTEVPGMPPQVAPAIPGFGVGSGSTAGPIPVTPSPAPGYQPPVSGALPSAVPEAATAGAVDASVTPVGAVAGEAATGSAVAPVGPSAEILDQISRSQAGKRFNQLFPQEQQIVRRIAERMSQPTAPMVDQTAQSLGSPAEIAPVPQRPEVAASTSVSGVPAPAPTPQVWRQFVSENMSEAMKSTGSHGAAMTELGKQWKARSAVPSPATAPTSTAGAISAPSAVPGNSAEIAAALRDEMVRSGTIAPEAASPVSGAPDPTPLADMMRELPQGTKKAVAKANYRAVKEGATSAETAAPTYEAAGRATKVDPVVKAILDNGITYSDIIKLTKSEIQSLADQLSRATAAEGGQHPGHAFSALSVDEMIGQLRMAEDAAKRAAKPR